MNNPKISTRLSLSFGLVVLIPALLAGIGIWRLNVLTAANHEIADNTRQAKQLAEQSAAAAESLKVQAQQLVEGVAVFRLAPNGLRDAAAPEPLVAGLPA